MRGQAQDRLMNKLAAARHKAEEKRAVAEAKRNQEAAKTEQQSEYIRKTGRIPSSITCCVNLSRHDSSVAIQSATTFLPPPSTARSVSMRDMGTEMTPIASQEPSRTGTPVRATTPMRSPTSSRPSTPSRAAPASSPTDPPNGHPDTHKHELSEKELQMKTRREIMVLGTQLGKMNIAAWASKEEEDKDASTSLKNLAGERPAKSVIETRAAAWEDAEKAKYTARLTMCNFQVEVERMRGQAQDRLMNKLAAARHKAEEKRAVAEAKRNQEAAKTEQQSEYIRKTGRIPSSNFTLKTGRNKKKKSGSVSNMNTLWVSI
ncbi:uncharacterized protein CFP56_007609 [Quercus suber]|uniref:Remorin C-terminal domain-containing protein n=1 Tax=Quercus suber TaxID=58331 RepID=A0AAW0L6W2_QUESU